MPTLKLRASTILGAFEQAQTELVGKAVILTDGKAGTVENVWLDELHGLRISIRGPRWKVAHLNDQIRGDRLKRLVPAMAERLAAVPGAVNGTAHGPSLVG